MSISKAIEAVIVGACTLTFALMVLAMLFVYVPLLTGNGPMGHEAISFWSAGQQLAHGRNPYDAAETLRMQLTADATADAPLIMRNPPIILPLVLPLGHLSQRGAALLWSALLIAAFLLSVRLLWDAFGRPQGPLRWLPYAFAPALICIFAGQSAVLSLLGLALFVRFHRTHPFAAGAALWLCMLKPHLLLPFAAVLLLWSIRERQFRILAGAAAVLAASLAVAWALDPHAWSQYAQMARSSGVDREYIPCISVALRFAIQPGALWLQWLPCAVGCTFAVLYYWRHRASWDWCANGGMVLLLSLLVAPYAWVSDMALALPAMMYSLLRRPSRVMLLLLAILMGIMEAEVLAAVKWHSPLYLWPAAAWLLWYLCNNALARQPQGETLVRDPVYAHCA